VSWRCPQAIQRIKTTTQKTRHKFVKHGFLLGRELELGPLFLVQIIRSNRATQQLFPIPRVLLECGLVHATIEWFLWFLPYFLPLGFKQCGLANYVANGMLLGFSNQLLECLWTMCNSGSFSWSTSPTNARNSFRSKLLRSLCTVLQYHRLIISVSRTSWPPVICARSRTLCKNTLTCYRG
jgi:hypothetical protein